MDTFSIDPAVQLPEPIVAAFQPGPANRAQLVIELAGPQPAPAGPIARLMDLDWQNALGQPEAWVMTPTDAHWQPLVPRRDGAYDSIALCWDLISERGVLTGAAATRLLNAIDPFAQAIGRRAIAMPGLTEIDGTVRALKQVQSELDAGFSLMVLVPRQVSERDLWRQCARLGLEFSGSGEFVYRSSKHPSPLFAVTPIGDTESFSLAGVQSGRHFDGVTLGFSIPRCPSPRNAFQQLLRAAGVVASGIGGMLYDDEGQPWDPRKQSQSEAVLSEVVAMLERAKLAPGSASALIVF